MPIKPENRHRYPANWPEIRERIRQRSSDRCEWCGIHNHAVGYRKPDGAFVMLGRSPEDAGMACDAAEADGFKVIRIVLTVAHVHDHDPENCADDNLAHLCQRCHNKHDAPMRRQHAAESRKSGKAIAELF
jgi:hypothetical protein